MTIADDRVLARCAFEAVGWNIAAAAEAVADIAVGDAITSLRVLGVAVGPEIVRTVRNDVELILDDPAKVARAAAMAKSADRRRPANANRAIPLRAMQAAI